MQLIYNIVYKILEDGSRVTKYFKEGKLFSTIKDNINPDYGWSEQIPKTTLKGKTKFDLINDKTGQLETEAEAKGEKAAVDANSASANDKASGTNAAGSASGPST